MKPIHLLSALVAVMVLNATSKAATLDPISLSGFQLDNIYIGGNDLVTPDNNGFEFFSGTANGSGNGSPGLPASGSFISDYNPSTTFQLASYSSKNITQSINGGSSVLSLSTPASYSNLAFLVTNIGTGGATFTLNFSDGTTATDSVSSIPYWVNGPGTSHEALFSYPLVGNGSPIDFYEYDYDLAPADEAKTLDSVTITSVQGLNGNGDALYQNLNGFAISGTMAVPEPSTWAMLVIGAAALLVLKPKLLRA